MRLRMRTYYGKELYGKDSKKNGACELVKKMEYGIVSQALSIDNRVDDNEFSKLVQEYLKRHSNGTRDLAHTFGVSFSTVKRWASRAGSPHPVMRSLVIAHLNKELKKTSESPS